jgi:hypothetical protein
MKLSALWASCPLPLQKFLVHICVRSWVNIRAKVQLGFGQWKNPMASPGIVRQKYVTIYLAASSKISFCDCDNKFGQSKASGISTRDSNSQISHAFLSVHDELPHNSELPVTLPGLGRSHFWKQFHMISVSQLSWQSQILVHFICTLRYSIYFVYKQKIN